MITGRINSALRAVMTVNLFDSTGLLTSVEVLIDTGFDGDLTLPRRVLRNLGARYAHRQTVILADGRTVSVKQYFVNLEWDGIIRPVLAISAQAQALIGMSLLHGYRLDVPVRYGEQVVISALPPKTVP